MRRLYGASPLHLVGHLLLLAASAYALSLMVTSLGVAFWLLGAVVLHDAVFLPAYSGLDRLGQRVVRDRPERPVPLVNHVRVPLALSGLLLLVWFPAILGLNADVQERVSGRTGLPYARDWLLITVVLIVGSAVVWIVRARRSARRRPADP